LWENPRCRTKCGRANPIGKPATGAISQTDAIFGKNTLKGSTERGEGEWKERQKMSFKLHSKSGRKVKTTISSVTNWTGMYRETGEREKST